LIRDALDAPTCSACGETLDHRGECAAIGCVEYERAVHGPIRYEVQFGGWSVPCATLRRAIDVRGSAHVYPITAVDYVPVDESDWGLTALELEAVTLPDCNARDALVAFIDGIAAKRAA
jgi:hypothetical protein